MTASKVTFITDFFYSNHTDDDFFRDRFFYLKLHALFNCLTEHELKSLFLSQISQEINFSRSLLSFIVKKASNKQIDFNQTAIELLEKYPSQSYKTQLAYRTILSTVIKFLDKEVIIEYFNLFIKSDRINDRKKSYEIAEFIWPEVENIIWDYFFKFREEKALIQIINFSSADDIILNLNKIWQKNFPKNILKKLILDKTRQSDVSNFEFLKTLEPTFYIQALILRNIPIETKLLNSVVKKMKNENNGFVFYYLGLAKNWKLLTATLESMKSIRFEE